MEGLVPPYEEHEAAAAASVAWNHWRDLTCWDRARVIVWYRYHRLVEASVQDAASAQARTAAARKRN